MTTTDTCRTIRDFSARSIPSILRSYCAAVLLLFVFLVQTFAAAAASPAKPDIFLAYKKCQWEEITSAEEKRKICTLLAESCEANYSKLSTWQAAYRYSRFSFESTKEKPANIHHLPPDYQDYSIGQVEFSLDFRKDLLNWKYQCAESVHTKEPEPVANFPVPATARHVTPEESTYQAVYLPNSQFVRKSFQAVTGQIHTMPGYSLHVTCKVGFLP